MIRPANSNDLVRIVEMSEKFYQTTKYQDFADFNAPTCAVLAQTLMEVGVLLVAEVEGKVVGMVGLILTPFLFNCSIIGAYEIVWWVDPEHQGSRVGFNLLKAIEPACKEKGASIIQMVSLPSSPPAVESLYKKMGYSHSESSYTKVI